MIPPEARDEILSSCAAIRSLTGRTRIPFAFPHSADGLDPTWLRDLAAAEVGLGLLFDTHLLRRDDPILVNRIIVDRPPAQRGGTDLPRELLEVYREEILSIAAQAIRGRR